MPRRLKSSPESELQKVQSEQPSSAVLLAPPPAEQLVRISLLGGLRIERPGEAAVTRFQTQKTAGLLAYLALHPSRAHGREFLTDLFWPNAEMEDGRRSFRTALSSLRRQLEPPGTPMGTLLIADRTTAQLNFSHIETDIARFSAASLAETDGTPAQEEVRLEAAIAWYRGVLLPGFYDDWVMGERERLVDLYRSLLLRRAALAEQRGGLELALDYARRAVHLEQNKEAAGTEAVYQPAHIAVIRLLARTGRPEEAQRHYAVFAERLRDLYDESPPLEARDALTMAPTSEATQVVHRTDDAAVVTVPSPQIPSRRIVSLPLTLTRFFGRGPERDLLARTFSDSQCRLITLTGPGGSGKTRFAVEWARQWSEDFPTATAAFVPLADLGQASYLWSAIAQTLFLERLSDPGAVRSQVCEALNRFAEAEDGQVSGPLLVLDNFEEWVDRGASLVESLLQAVPRLRLIVTSRRRLQIGGEREIPVGPLPVPTLPGTPERLLEWASVQLFVNRAQSARPDFQITVRNTETITTLCQRLDGVPLALELTATWAGALSPSQMLERVSAHLLDEAGPPLAHQRAQRPERHRTLRAALDTSVSLLSTDLQTAFVRLSVFRGGWTLEAAEIALSGLGGGTADLLSRLRERSLLIAESSSDGESLRFRLLPVLREYADEALEGVERQKIQDAHATYFLQFAEATAPLMLGTDVKAAIDALEIEHDNIRAALDYLSSEKQTETATHQERGLRLAGAMAHFWLLRGYWDEGLLWLDRALRDSENDKTIRALRARVLRSRGKITYEQADYASTQTAYEESLTIWRELNDEAEIANLLHGMASLTFHADCDYERARALVEECLVLRRRLGDRLGIGTAIAGLGSIAVEQGDYAKARACYQEWLEGARELGNREHEANALFNLGNTAYSEGLPDEAETLFKESLQIHTELGNRQRIGHCWSGLGNVATDRGDHAAARAAYHESLHIAQQLNETWAIGALLNNLGKVYYYEKDFVQAKKLCLQSLQLRVDANDKAGAARVLVSLAFIAAAQNEAHLRAAILWGAAHGIREQLGIPIAESLHGEHDESIALVRAALGEKAFDTSWGKGAAFTFEESIAFAQE